LTRHRFNVRTLPPRSRKSETRESTAAVVLLQRNRKRETVARSNLTKTFFGALRTNNGNIRNSNNDRSDRTTSSYAIGK
jgi:hypothetical protein